MLTGRLAFSTHKQQIYCILCHAQNQFSVSVAVAVAVAVAAYQHTLLISCVQSFSGFGLSACDSGSALAWGTGTGTGSGAGWGSLLLRCFAEPAPKIANDFQSMMLLRMMSMSQCRWHLSPRRKTKEERRVGAAVADKAIVVVNKNQFDCI